ncbi:MAG: rsmA [Solirubrobacterales bacterium]|nr:rsmA [Solirubrobacterales bacterium]
MRLGQNFLVDPNLLTAIVREADPSPDDVVLEIGGGEGALTAKLAPRVATVHVVELDERLRPALERVAAAHGNVELHFADAMRFDLARLEPPPDRMVANLPYSIATPLILRTIAELEGLRRWTLMVQREIADRLRASPGSRLYGSPSVLVQLACEVRLLRTVDRAVFKPRPRVDSALLELVRGGPAAAPVVVELVRDAFAHRRKSLARSLEHARPGTREAARTALERLDLPADARAEQVAPAQYVALAKALR